MLLRKQALLVFKGSSNPCFAKQRVAHFTSLEPIKKFVFYKLVQQKTNEVKLANLIKLLLVFCWTSKASLK